MSFFVNIHTHRKPRLSTEIVIRNAYLHSFKNTDTKYLVSVGAHPWFAVDTDYTDILQKLASNKHVAAIGECGLDAIKGKPLPVQKQVFWQHIYVANNLKKPLILHIVKSYHLLPEFLKQIRVPVILHGYHSSIDLTATFLKFDGVYFSFGSKLLRNPEAFAKIINQIPIEKMFFETDNKPITIDSVYACAAKLKNINTDELKHAVYRNYIKIFVN